MANDQLLTELEAIREENNGLLRAEDVVRFAEQNPESALHAQFEWDDSKAAYSHRLEQARSVIRVCVTLLPQTTVPQRVYVSLEPDRQVKGGGYRHISQVITDQTLRQILLKQALRDAYRFKQKYQHLTEFAAVVGEIDALALESLINEDRLDLALEQGTVAPAQ